MATSTAATTSTFFSDLITRTFTHSDKTTPSTSCLSALASTTFTLSLKLDPFHDDSHPDHQLHADLLTTASTILAESYDQHEADYSFIFDVCCYVGSLKNALPSHQKLAFQLVAALPGASEKQRWVFLTFAARIDAAQVDLHQVNIWQKLEQSRKRKRSIEAEKALSTDVVDNTKTAVSGFVGNDRKANKHHLNSRMQHKHSTPRLELPERIVIDLTDDDQPALIPSSNAAVLPERIVIDLTDDVEPITTSDWNENHKRRRIDTYRSHNEADFMLERRQPDHTQYQTGRDDEDRSSKPRCQRCRRSKKGCDRQRPCQRCKDTGIGIDGCVTEDEPVKPPRLIIDVLSMETLLDEADRAGKPLEIPGGATLSKNAKKVWQERVNARRAQNLQKGENKPSITQNKEREVLDWHKATSTEDHVMQQWQGIHPDRVVKLMKEPTPLKINITKAIKLFETAQAKGVPFELPANARVTKQAQKCLNNMKAMGPGTQHDARSLYITRPQMEKLAQKAMSKGAPLELPKHAILTKNAEAFVVGLDLNEVNNSLDQANIDLDGDQEMVDTTISAATKVSSTSKAQRAVQVLKLGIIEVRKLINEANAQGRPFVLPPNQELSAKARTLVGSYMQGGIALLHPKITLDKIQQLAADAEVEECR